MQLTGAEILIEELVKHDVKTVFGYPGGAVLHIYDELYKNQHRINHIITAHEQGAAHAADGYARVSGEVGVVIATSGPGSTNLVTGIANAYLDSIPLIVITGNVGVSLLGKDSFQEVDIVGITLPIIKHNFVVRDINSLEKTIKEAFLIANSGRKGPVLVDIPKNIQIESCEYTQEPVKNDCCEIPHENDFSLAIEAIKSAEKPFIYCGGGVIFSEAEEEVLELSKRISAPIGLSMMGLTAIPNSYELNLGMCGMHGKFASSKAQAECDLMIAIGVRFSDRATGCLSKYSKNCKIIHIDIDAAELDKNVKCKIGLCGDVKDILFQLLPMIDEKKHKNWIEQVIEYKKTDEIPMRGDFTPQCVIETVNKFCDKDTVIATDVGQHQMWTTMYYQFEKPRTLLTSGGLGTMGFGLGAAIGGCFANDLKKTVLFTSDGSFGMNLNELATAVSQNLPVVVVILNNGVLGMVRQWQHMFYGERYSQTTLDRKTDFVALAKAFGADGYRATNCEELQFALSNTKDNLPCVIDCTMDKDDFVLPMIPPACSINDIIVKS